MLNRPLGKSGFNVSVIGFGGIPIQRLEFAQAEIVLHAALERGVNFIDTARGYTDSEQKIGRALADRREKVVLATKAMSIEGAAMAEELATSLRELRTDTIDLYQLHGVGSAELLDRAVGPGGAYEVLAKAREQGKVHAIGITSHSRAVLHLAVETGLFDTVQLPFNPFETEAKEDVIPSARAHGVGTIGMKPVAGGAIASVPAALRFSLTQGIDVVIPGMDSVEQVEQNTAVGIELRAPSDEERGALNREKAFWGERFCRRCAYCMPCPNGLAIPLLLLLEAYYTRYGLEEWALQRLAGAEKSYSDCTGCEECLTKCPYELPIPEMMSRAAELMK